MIPWASFNSYGNEKEYINDALESGWVSGGKYIDLLEKEVEKLYKNHKALCVSNGTAALQLAFQTINIKPGDDIVVPSFSFQAAGNIAQQLGANPVFCDIDPLTWNVTAQALEKKITPKTKALVIVHNYGVACEINQIRELCDNHRLYLIEDCAEAWFSKYNGQYVGSLSDIATFSMHATKTISSGEGGVVLFREKEKFEKAKLIRSHGLDRSISAYNHKIPGNNFRLSNLLAAIGFGQLEAREKIIKKQRLNSNCYLQKLNNSDFWTIQKGVEQSSNLPWAFALRINFSNVELSRDEIIKALSDRGIETRPGFVSSNFLIYNADKISECPVSDSINKDLLVLPCPLQVTKKQINEIAKSLKDIFEKSNPKYQPIKAITNQSINPEKFDEFKNNLKIGKLSFRYFNKRKTQDILRNKFVVVIEQDETYIGYGHIDFENGTNWVGICIGDNQYGRHLGSFLMQKLLTAANRLKIDSLELKVDVDNKKAQWLYKKYGFFKNNELSNEESFHYERKI